MKATTSTAVTQADMGQLETAVKSITEAEKVAEALFKNDSSDANIASYQMVLLNAGIIYKSKFYNTKQQKSLDADALKKALGYLYLTLSVARRIRKDIIIRCLRALTDLYTQNFGAVGYEACERLSTMYPDFAEYCSPSRGTAVNFLIDVSASMNTRIKGTHMRRIEATVSTLIRILREHIADGESFSLSTFGHLYTTVVAPCIMGPKNRIPINTQIAEITATENRTFFWSALMQLASETEKATSNYGKDKWIVALTDGGDNDRRSHEYTVHKAKAALAAARVKLIVVAVDVDEIDVRNMRDNLVEKPEYVLGVDSEHIMDALEKGFRMADSGGEAVMESL